MTGHTTLVEYEVSDGVGLLTLANAPTNAYSYTMMLQLDRWILEARRDDDVQVIVVVGGGERFFCGGADAAWLQTLQPTEGRAFYLHTRETLLRLENTPKLVIGALNGHAIGGGLEVAMACDLRIARRGRDSVGVPEVPLGVRPGNGESQRLSRLIGASRAAEWIASGHSHDFDSAQEVGLVNRVVDAADRSDFLSQALAWARSHSPSDRAADRPPGPLGGELPSKWLDTQGARCEPANHGQ